jgi:hypothetical protein
MDGAREQQTDAIRRQLKPADVVKWYREIMGLDRGTPLPPHITYKEMLATVLEHDSTSGGELGRSVA